MMITQMIRDDDDRNNTNNGVLDLSVRKRLPLLLSPPSSTTSSSSSASSSSIISSKRILPPGKRMLDLNTSIPSSTPKLQQTNKRPLRFQCKHCDYKAPSTSLMQNHIYRHTDLTPYACAYCGHKSTTKSTIMVHIELCHPHMEVKIHENRVREQDFYRDLNSSDIATLSNTVQEPQLKKQRRSNQYDSEAEPINGVAISLKTIMDDGNEFSPAASDEIYETDHFESVLLPTPDILDDDIEHTTETHSVNVLPSFKLKFSPPSTPLIDSSSAAIDTKGSDSDDGSEYLLVYNRPKQYYGSLYEPDKQYACKLCSYTTNHRPSMEDHVYVHTNEKPYKCGYCGEEIHTRYAATYHIKYKHTGMARNFIQNKADITQYYVNRAKKDEEKNQFKVLDTRRVKVPYRSGKANNNHLNKLEIPAERPSPRESSPSPPVLLTPSTLPVQTTTPSLSNSPAPTPPDYRFLLAWSYYLATQAAWLSPMLQQQQQQQQGHPPLSLPTDPESAAKFLQAMQTAINPLAPASLSNNTNNHEQTESETKKMLSVVKEETNRS